MKTTLDFLLDQLDTRGGNILKLLSLDGDASGSVSPALGVADGFPTVQ